MTTKQGAFLAAGVFLVFAALMTLVNAANSQGDRIGCYVVMFCGFILLGGAASEDDGPGPA